MTETQRAAMQAAHDALAIAQNNLAASRESAIAFDDGDLWDKYQRAMKVNTFRLVHAYGEGGRRYHYDVTPDTAAFVAAASIAEEAMVKAMLEASKVQPAQSLEKYTIKQLEAISKARDIMESAGCFVSHWQYAGVHDIVRYGIEAVKKCQK